MCLEPYSPPTLPCGKSYSFKASASMLSASSNSRHCPSPVLQDSFLKIQKRDTSLQLRPKPGSGIEKLKSFLPTFIAAFPHWRHVILTSLKEQLSEISAIPFMLSPSYINLCLWHVTWWGGGAGPASFCAHLGGWMRSFPSVKSWEWNCWAFEWILGVPGGNCV